MLSKINKLNVMRECVKDGYNVCFGQMAHNKVNEFRLNHREQQHLNLDTEASKAI